MPRALIQLILLHRNCQITTFAVINTYIVATLNLLHCGRNQMSLGSSQWSRMQPIVNERHKQCFLFSTHVITQYTKLTQKANGQKLHLIV